MLVARLLSPRRLRTAAIGQCAPRHVCRFSSFSGNSDDAAAQSPAAVAAAAVSAPVAAVRNIGIMAHIDAGKTTVTERMLYHAGLIRAKGEVHDGNTVMDFMAQERERGITIQSAAISMRWRPTPAACIGTELDTVPVDVDGYSLINLLDTPGHVDFTLEVERSMRVMDGAVAVLDSVAGVQAQTETVWEQAGRHGVARIAFVNKLDRDGASLRGALRSMRARLGVAPLLLQLPLFEHAGAGADAGEGLDTDGGSGGALVGVLDLVSLELWRWDAAGGGDGGVAASRAPLPALARAQAAGGARASSFGALLARAAAARLELVQALSDLDTDDTIAELYLEGCMVEEERAEAGGAGAEVPAAAAAERWLEAVPPAALWAALRRVVHGAASGLSAGAGAGATPVPVLCGAALQDVGVEPLMDGVVRLLPSPADCAVRGARRLRTAAELREAHSARRGGRKKGARGQQSAAASADEDSAGARVALTVPAACNADPGGPLAALAFKVVHAAAAQGRALTMVRVYSGTLRARDGLLNATATASAWARAQEQAAATDAGGGRKSRRGGGGNGGSKGGAPANLDFNTHANYALDALVAARGRGGMGVVRAKIDPINF
eukprot:g2306.t1